MSRIASKPFRVEIEYEQNQIMFCREQADYYRGLETRSRRRPGGAKNAELARGLVQSFQQELLEHQDRLAQLQELSADHHARAAEDHQA